MTSALRPPWIGVDVGDTKVLAGVVDETGRGVASPGRGVDIRQVEDTLEAAVLDAADGQPIAGVGLAGRRVRERGG